MTGTEAGASGEKRTAGTESFDRALLVGCRLRGELNDQAFESLDELGLLVKTAGAVQTTRVKFDVNRISASTFFGSGQVQKIARTADETEADFIVCDVDLAPSQQRNIEKLTEKMVIDRTGIILDIFALRAHSKEGKLQVELAQLEYLLPRLRGMWTHLSRQGAGIGTRGPGETDLEIDRRRIQERISRIRRELVKVKKTRDLHRRSRLAVPYPTAVLVGYTNAGKSTLLNRMTGASVLVEDKLFATLDPTVRELRLPDGDRVLLSDTVGFIRKLPHQLVESFSATFEEISSAHMLLHLVDGSNPMAEEHVRTTLEVLQEMGVEQNRILMVLNKVDQVQDQAVLASLLRKFPEAVAVSAAKGIGIDNLEKKISEKLSINRIKIEIELPYRATEAIRRVNNLSKILDTEYLEDRIRMIIETDKKLAAFLQEYRV